MRELENKVAPVTGASRGIGRGIAEPWRPMARWSLFILAGIPRLPAERWRPLLHEEAPHLRFRLIWHLLKTSSASFFALDEQLTMQTGSNQLDIPINNLSIASSASYRQMSAAQFNHLSAELS